jgi:hypothetical protein
MLRPYAFSRKICGNTMSLAYGQPAGCPYTWAHSKHLVIFIPMAEANRRLASLREVCCSDDTSQKTIKMIGSTTPKTKEAAMMAAYWSIQIE